MQWTLKRWTNERTSVDVRRFATPPKYTMLCSSSSTDFLVKAKKYIISRPVGFVFWHCSRNTALQGMLGICLIIRPYNTKQSRRPEKKCWVTFVFTSKILIVCILCFKFFVVVVLLDFFWDLCYNCSDSFDVEHLFYLFILQWIVTKNKDGFPLPLPSSNIRQAFILLLSLTLLYLVF